MGKMVYSSEWSASERAAAAKSAKSERKESSASPDTAPRLPNDGWVRVGRETQGRKGGGVTVVTGIPLAGDALSAFAKQAKSTLGTGGTLRGGVLELQGDVRDRAVALMEKQGWKVKRAGG
jgi:translation initiation factor 1